MSSNINRILRACLASIFEAIEVLKVNNEAILCDNFKNPSHTKIGEYDFSNTNAYYGSSNHTLINFSTVT